MMNAYSTLVTKQEIPRVLWDNKYNIGFWEWELDIFPEDWMGNLQYYDEVWAPSRFTADSITQSKGYNGTPVKVLPLPLNDNTQISSDAPSGRLHELFELVHDSFVFLIIFDFMSTTQRKNPEASISAFLDAFPVERVAKQRYHLIVKSHGHNKLSALNELKAHAKNDSRVLFLSETLTDNEHSALQKRADCYISLHRSEGYGMNILEEMGKGIPVIATNYSGNVDFFPPVERFLGSCIFAIPFKLVNLTDNFGSYREGNRWAEPDHESAVSAMREVVKNNCKQENGKIISDIVISHFGRNATGEKIRKLLVKSLGMIKEKEKKMMLAYETGKDSVTGPFMLFNI